MRGVRRTKLFRAQTTPPPPKQYFPVKPLNAIFLFQLVLCCCICLFQQVKKNIAQISLGKVIAPSLVVHLLQN